MKFWWLNDPKNFGDLITPYLLDYFNIKYEYSENDYEAICTGSIAFYAKKNTLVLGSGVIRPEDAIEPKANWKWVRGPLSRNRILAEGGVCPEIYGDPALLLPLLCSESKKQYDIGIVPHYVDLLQVQREYPGYHIISPLNPDPLEVIKEITKCRYILSSSLHGIIVAHAYDIPAAWTPFSNKLRGGDFKFKDYYLSVNLQCISSTVNSPVFTTGKIDIDPMKNIFKSMK